MLTLGTLILVSCFLVHAGTTLVAMDRSSRTSRRDAETRATLMPAHPRQSIASSKPRERRGNIDS